MKLEEITGRLVAIADQYYKVADDNDFRSGMVDLRGGKSGLEGPFIRIYTSNTKDHALYAGRDEAREALETRGWSKDVIFEHGETLKSLSILVKELENFLPTFTAIATVSEEEKSKEYIDRILAIEQERQQLWVKLGTHFVCPSCGMTLPVSERNINPEYDLSNCNGCTPF